MIPNQVQSGPIWRVDAQGIATAIEGYVLGSREMTAAQVNAGLALLKLAKLQSAGLQDSLEDLA